MPHYFEQVLAAFPFSRLTQAPSLMRVYAVEYAEPALYEQMFPAVPDAAALAEVVRQFLNPDCCYEVEAAWDLWQRKEDWALAPSRVVIQCCGPEFLAGAGEHIRVFCGIDSLFLPDPALTGSARFAESNLRSLLKLSHDLDAALPVERHLLWTESGENFAALLERRLLH